MKDLHDHTGEHDPAGEKQEYWEKLHQLRAYLEQRERDWHSGEQTPVEERERLALLEHLRAIRLLDHAGGEPKGPPAETENEAEPPTRSILDSDLDETVGPSSRPTASVQASGWNDYEILQEIARGGMGVVYKARQVSLNRVVALKMILSGQFAGEQEVQRFRAEAEAAANLEHSNIIPIHEIGEHDGQQYFSMGYVEGRSLAARVSEGPLPPLEAAALVRKIARAVSYANDKGVIHRDLKPGNVLLDEAGEPHVTDFGIAKRIGKDSALTATGQILGTPSYMPPEQALGLTNQVDERSDVYALGAILYATLTGRPPHQAANPLDTIKSVIEREPLAPSTLDRSVPRDLETICLKALAKEPDRRYGCACDLADDLGRYLNNEPIVARSVGTLEKAWLWRRRNPRAALGLYGAVVLLIIGGVVAWEWRGRLQATALVDNLIQASVDDIPDVAVRLQPYLRWAKPRLNALAASEAESDAQRRRQLHAQIGLAKSDPKQHESLRQALLDETFDLEYLQVIGDALTEATTEFTSNLWEAMRSPSQPLTVRFRAGLVLSRYAPFVEGEQNSRWNAKEDARFLVRQYLDANPESHGVIRGYLKPNASLLQEQLAELYQEEDASTAQQLAAARAIAEFYPADLDYLHSLLLAGTGPQYLQLYPLIEQTSDLDQQLIASASQPPAPQLTPSDRIVVGKERAGSAITLLRKDGVERASRHVFKALEMQEDPEAMTQFIHRCRARGVKPEELLNLWQAWKSLPQTDRFALTATGRRQLDSPLFAILLALGEFSLPELPEGQQAAVIEEVAELHASHPSSAIHGAAGWLLRRWQRADLANAVDQTPVAYEEGREWFTLQAQVEVLGEAGIPQTRSLFFTFVVFPPDSYTMGSPEGEKNRFPNESRHKATFTRPLAVQDRELAWSQFSAFDGDKHRLLFQAQFGHSLDTEYPVFGVNWFESVAYSRWLGERFGLTEDQQCYPRIELPANAESGFFELPDPTPWPLDLNKAGFRLPTEAEWERACRGGTASAFSFGGDWDLLRHYCWFEDNSAEWPHGVGELRPNPRGLFDVHGNLYEWCQNWYGDVAETADDALGPASGYLRVSRGGGWGNPPRNCRAAHRHGYLAGFRSNGLGFRLVFRPSVGAGPASGPAQPPAL